MRFTIWLPTVMPIFVSSPAAWMAVVTSSVPRGTPPLEGGGAGSRRSGCSSDGAPALTARGRRVAARPDAALRSNVLGAGASVAVAVARGLPFAAAGLAFAVRRGAAGLVVRVPAFFAGSVARDYVAAGAAGAGTSALAAASTFAGSGWRRARRVGRVAGRLPRTLCCAGAFFLAVLGLVFSLI